jgi:salicylate hydroxylase
MKVLNLVGLASTMASSSIASAELRDQTSTGKTLGLSHLPGTLIARYGQPAVGVRRTLLNLELQQMLIAQGIELHQGHALEEIEEHEDRVVAVFQGGRRREGMFLVGCDGIKAVSRQLLLRVKGIPQVLPSYTGLTQVSSSAITLGRVMFPRLRAQY